MGACGALLRRTHMGSKNVLRDLAKRVQEIANKPVQEERRRLWEGLNSFSSDKPLIYVRACAFDEFFDTRQLKCDDPDLRRMEKDMHALLFQDTVGDDYIIEPWLTHRAIFSVPDDERWGLSVSMNRPGEHILSAGFSPKLVEESDFDKMKRPSVVVAEEKTALLHEKLSEAIGGVLPLCIDKIPTLAGPIGDISTDLGKLRGIEQLMTDGYDRPEWFHKVLTFMRDGCLKAQEETEKAGHYTTASQLNQAMPYCKELPRPDPSGTGVHRSQIWTYMAAQEFTGCGPDYFQEFIYQYQIPLMENFGMVSYGCCEDMSYNLSIIKRLKNLRRIAITPFSDLKKCAEQINDSYIASWRPNPSAMLATGLDEDYVRSFMQENLAVLMRNNCRFDITLKDVETVAHKPENISRWVALVRQEIDRLYR